MEMNLEHPATSTPGSLGELPGLANFHIIWTRSLFYPLLKYCTFQILELFFLRVFGWPYLQALATILESA